MSSQQGGYMRYTRSRTRRRMLDVDLNAVPPCESPDQDGISNDIRAQDRQAPQGGGSMVPLPIDVDAIGDDDVIISSQREFAEATKNSRRNRGQNTVIDVESEDRSSRNKRRRFPTNQAVINCDVYVNLDGSSNSTRRNGQSAAMPPVHPPPPKRCQQSVVTFSAKHASKLPLLLRANVLPAGEKQLLKTSLECTFQLLEVLEASLKLIHPFMIWNPDLDESNDE